MTPVCAGLSRWVSVQLPNQALGASPVLAKPDKWVQFLPNYALTRTGARISRPLIQVHQIIVWQENRIKVETLESPFVHGHNQPPMTRNPNETRPTFFSRLHCRLDDSTGSQGLLPFIRMPQVVQLDQVNLIQS